MKKIISLLLALFVFCALIACEDNSSVADDPMLSFKTQKVHWQPCDPTFTGQEHKEFEKLGNRMSCAELRVPMDHHSPARGELSMAVIRVAAANPARRKGVIVFNPGGPGGDGLILAPYFALLGMLAAQDPVSSPSAWQVLANQYDFIGFSPRGVGASSRLTCVSNELARPARDLYEDRTTQNIANHLYNVSLETKACRRNPLTPYINTEQTARDMDMLRALLNEAKLNYIGYSYGTWLGLWYASLFPRHVGRMVIDSNTDFTGTFDDIFQILLPAGYQRAFNEVLAPYAARHPAVFNLGATEQEVRQAYTALPPYLRYIVTPLLIQSLRHRALVDSGLAALSAAKSITPLLNSRRLPQEIIIQYIQSFVFSADNTIDEEARQFAAQFIELYYNQIFQPATAYPYASHIANINATFLAVRCNDTKTKSDPQFWLTLGHEAATKYPLTGADSLINPCTYWVRPNIVKPDAALANKAGSLLMVQSEFDAPTPREGAENTFAALPNAKMVFVKDEHSHGIFPYGTACVDQTVLQFFITESPQVLPRRMICPSKPLNFDTVGLSVMEFDEAKKHIMSEIHSIIHRNALGATVSFPFKHK